MDLSRAIGLTALLGGLAVLFYNRKNIIQAIENSNADSLSTLPDGNPIIDIPLVSPTVSDLANVDIADPIFETDYPLTIGFRNKNPGNIRWIPVPAHRWRGMVAYDARGYAIFDSMQNGVRAIGMQLRAYEARGLNTIRSLITTWAPPTENDTSAYVNDVSNRTNIPRDVGIDVESRIVDIVGAIIWHENSFQPIPPSIIRVWIDS